jgi:hypothetical protein
MAFASLERAAQTGRRHFLKEPAMGISLRQPESYFSDTLQVRCPPTLPPAVERAASLNLMTCSEYVRRCIIDRLKADGVKLRPDLVPAAKSGPRVTKKGNC